ncbi:MAG: A24 family peptidase [Chloroflexota bacterium]
MAILYLLDALIGWLVGVAINHAADLLPRRQSLRQWPVCPACARQRAYPAWSALLAALTGQQNCPHCQQPRPRLIRSMIVESATPLIFIFMLWQQGLSVQLVLLSIYTAVLILITVTDLEHRLIFNGVVLPSILFGLGAAFLNPEPSWLSALIGGVSAFILSYLAALVARGGLGGGDVTLSTFLGVIIGFPYVLLSLTLGVFLGGFVAFLLLMTRRVGLKTFIPYGPFLTTTGWIMLIWGSEIWAYYF